MSGVGASWDWAKSAEELGLDGEGGGGGSVAGIESVSEEGSTYINLRPAEGDTVDLSVSVGYGDSQPTGDPDNEVFFRADGDEVVFSIRGGAGGQTDIVSNAEESKLSIRAMDGQTSSPIEVWNNSFTRMLFAVTNDGRLQLTSPDGAPWYVSVTNAGELLIEGPE